MKSEQQMAINVNVDGLIKTVPGVTKTTTCNDVIKSLTEAAGVGGCCELGIFESSCGIDRLIPGRTKILKVIRGWGTGSGQFGLVLRQVDPVQTTTSFFNLRKKLQKLKQRCTSQSAKTEEKMLNVAPTSEHLQN